jgi:Domain of unknown function (DUF4381)
MEESEKSFELVESRDAIDLVPSWEPQAWWYFTAAAVVFGTVLLVLLIRRKKSSADPGREKREAYIEAIADFGQVAPGDLRQTAVRVSEILRRYLAKSMRESALYETHEEFVARHDALKDLPEDVRQKIAVFFAKLAEVKYAPEPPDSEPAPIHAGGLELLERIHAA